MTAWLSKWSPLAGALCALLIVVAFTASGTGTPGDNSTGPQVIRWYTANHGRATLGDLLVGLAMFFLVVFAATLVRHVRRGDRWIATGALGGAVVAAVGLTFLIGFDLVLATDTKDLTSTSAQTLILLENDFFLPGRARLRAVRRPRRAGRGGRPDPAWLDGLGAVRHRHRGAGPADLLVRDAGDGAVGADRRDLDGGAGAASGGSGPSPSPPGSVSWPEAAVPGNEIGSHAIDPAGE